MDVAGAIGFTAIFPFVIGVVLTIVSGLYWEDKSPLDMHQGRVFHRLFGSALFLLALAVVSWIVAIWLGYAQGASG